MQVVRKTDGIAVDDAATEVRICFDKVNGTFENGPCRMHNRITELRKKERKIVRAEHFIR